MILDEWKRLSEPMGPSNAVLMSEPDSEKVEIGLQSWHVPLVAVSPAFQSQGIGSKLLDGFHAFIQGEASSLYSATPQLVSPALCDESPSQHTTECAWSY